MGPEVSRTTAGALLPRGLARGLRAEVGALSQVSGSSLSFPDGALPMVEGLQASLVAVQGPVGFPAPPWWCWMAASSVCVCACVIAPDPRRLTPQRIFLTVSGVLISQQNSCLMSVRLVDLQGERVVSRLVSMSRHGQVIFPGGRSWWTPGRMASSWREGSGAVEKDSWAVGCGAFCLLAPVLTSKGTCQPCPPSAASWGCQLVLPDVSSCGPASAEPSLPHGVLKRNCRGDI